MGVPDFLKFFSRECPEALTRLATPTELRRRAAAAAAAAAASGGAAAAADINRPEFDYVLVDMSNIMQTIGLQPVANLLMHQVAVQRAIILVGDSSRLRLGTRREARMVRADKDVDTAIAQLASQLKTFFGEQQQQAASASGDRRRQRPDQAAAPSNASASSGPLVVCVGSDVFGEGDFKLLNLHRLLALSSTTPKFVASASSNKVKQFLLDSCQQQPAQQQQAPTFLFVSEDSDALCGALCGPDPHGVSIATTFRDVLSELCLLSVGACADFVCRGAGLADLSNVFDPAERQRCQLNVALDLITLFTILLGNGQCPALAKGATRVDSKAIWQAYCQMRWPANSSGSSGGEDASTLAFKYPRGQFLVDLYSSRLHEQQQQKTAAGGDGAVDLTSSLVVNCTLLSKVLSHFHSADSAIAHAPVAEQRRVAREYLGLVAASAFNYSAGACIDTREGSTASAPGQQGAAAGKGGAPISAASAAFMAPSLASLSYVAEDAAFRFYPRLACSMEFGGVAPSKSTSRIGGLFGDEDDEDGGTAVGNSNKSAIGGPSAAAFGGARGAAFAAPAMRGIASANRAMKAAAAGAAAAATTTAASAVSTKGPEAAGCLFSVYPPGAAEEIRASLHVTLPSALDRKKSAAGTLTFADLRAAFVERADQVQDRSAGNNDDNDVHRSKKLVTASKFSFELRRMVPAAAPKAVAAAVTAGKSAAAADGGANNGGGNGGDDGFDYFDEAAFEQHDKEQASGFVPYQKFERGSAAPGEGKNRTKNKKKKERRKAAIENRRAGKGGAFAASSASGGAGGAENDE